MKRKLVTMLDVRNIIAIGILVLFITLSFMKVLQIDFIQNIILTVIAFYFAKDSFNRDDDTKN